VVLDIQEAQEEWSWSKAGRKHESLSEKLLKQKWAGGVT
jgi:hypothetical protein